MGFFLFTLALGFGSVLSLPDVPQRFLFVILITLFLIRTCFTLYKNKMFSRILLTETLVLSIFVLYQLLKNENALFYNTLMGISGSVAHLTGNLIGKPIAMGITYSGIDLYVLFLIAGMASFFLHDGVPLKKSLIFIVCTTILWVFYIAIWPALAESSLTLRLNLLEPLTGPLDYRILLFASLMSLFSYLWRKPDPSPSNEKPSVITMGIPSVLLVACVVTFLSMTLSVRIPPSGEGGRIVFWDTGIDFSVPEYGSYGLDYAGMFGVLPQYLEQKGYLCTTTQTLSKTLLEQTDVLVALNPMRMLNERERNAVEDFVWEGGSVLAVGDHTGDEQVRLPLNDMIEPSGISLNFDSAVPFRSLWPEGLRFRSGAISKGINSRQAQLVVGASLDLRLQAKPLLIGRAGFSDQGDLENTGDGYLGNLIFQRGERIGDLTLAAWMPWGQGMFMVFGDTTQFQNIVIPYSYPFIDRIFSYLCQGDGQADRKSALQENLFLASCIIDASHLPGFSRDKSGNAVDGLLACTMRAGFMPYLNQNQSLSQMLAQDENTKLIVFIEPAIAFSEKEIQMLRQFMEQGGDVWLCAGYDSPPASKEFASFFGFSFDPIPIGRIAPEQDPEMAFWNACPVVYQGENRQQTQSLMEIWGYSIIARKTIGSGGLSIFADPDFLKNKNLESTNTYREGNVLFLDTLLTEISQKER